jgi:hypothetical protein
MLKGLMNIFKSQFPKILFEPCPVKGTIETIFSVKKELLVFAPSGILRFSDHWYNEKNETFLDLSLLLKIDNL